MPLTDDATTLHRAAGVDAWAWPLQAGVVDGGAAPAAAVWEHRLHPDDRVAWHAQLRRCCERPGTVERAELRLRHTGDAYRWIRLAATVDCDARGVPARVRGCEVDITDCKQAEDQVSQWRERCDAALDSSGQLLYEWNRSVDRSKLVGNTLQLLGYTADELMGTIRDWMGRIHPEDLPAFMAEVERCTTTRTPFQCVYRLRRRDGQYALMHDRGHLIIGAEGDIHGIVGLMADITGQRKAEEERARLEAQLRQAQKMEALGTLAGGIAHDFNNMLGAIIGNAEMAMREAGAMHPVQRNLQAIDRAGCRARDLVRQILTFSRQRALERRVLQLPQVVDESLQLLRATLPAGVEMAATYDDDVPHVLADRTQVQQVLMNLCTNAWQALGGSTGRITVHVGSTTVGDEAPSPQLRPGRHARISVSDTGHGMCSETLQRIFDPFFTTKSQGTGLGLAVVDGIVKAHGGVIAVDSTVGRGTVFHVVLPAVDAEPEPVAVPAAARPGTGQRVIYLDDEEALVVLMTRMLEHLGYHARGFTDAEQALAALRTEPQAFDVLLTDLNMPGSTGLDVIARALHVKPGLRVALTSGYITDEERAQARSIGVTEVLYKPNTLEQVAVALDRLLGGAGAPDAVERLPDEREPAACASGGVAT